MEREDRSGEARANRFARARRVLEEGIRARAFPGCAFGVLAGGEVVAQEGLGGFTYEPDAPRVTAETVFDVASLTKVVAAAAMAMLLHQRGTLRLETPVGELVPEFVEGRRADDPARRIRVRHLLAHSAGLPGYVEFFRTAASAAAALEALMRLPVEAEPGTRAEYSDPGFMLLGKALEAVTAEPLATWVKREIFEALGMRATGYCPAPEARQAIPPTEEDTWLRHRRIQGEVQDENAWLLGGAAGHAGLFSHVPDLLRFAGEILAAERLFERTTVELFAQRQMPEGSARALGWDTPSGESSAGCHFSAGSIGHLGYSGCSLWVDRAAGIAVALLTNRTWPDRKSPLIRKVRPVFHDAVREEL